MKVIKKDDGVPVLLAHRTDGGKQITCWCPYCRLWHLHGIVGANIGVGDGHKQVHCLNPESHFLGTGYIIIEVDSISKMRARKSHPGIRSFDR